VAFRGFIFIYLNALGRLPYLTSFSLLVYTPHAFPRTCRIYVCMTFRVFILFMRGEEEGRDASFCALGFGLLRMGLGLRIGVRGVGGSNIT